MTKLTVLPGGADLAPDTRPALPRPAAIDLDQAEAFLLSLDQEMTGADPIRGAYLLGLAEGHLANLIEVLRAVAQ